MDTHSRAVSSGILRTHSNNFYFEREEKWKALVFTVYLTSRNKYFEEEAIHVLRP